MNKTILWLVAIFLLGAVEVAETQQPKKVHRIGFLSAAPSIDPAFLEGLHNLGYFEGKNIVVELRSAQGKLELLPDLAVELGPRDRRRSAQRCNRGHTVYPAGPV